MNQGGGGNQTVTQQNIPDWAMGYAQDTLNMGNQYTMNPNYRPSTLNRDYSGIRGYNAQGQPNSQVGQFGLNPNPAQPEPEPQPQPNPASPVFNDTFNDLFGGPLFQGVPMQNMGPDSFRTGLIENPNSPGFVDDRRNKTSRGGSPYLPTPVQNTGPVLPPFEIGPDGKPVITIQNDPTRSLGRTEGTTKETTQLPKNSVAATPPTGTPVILGYGRDYDPTKIYTDLELNALAMSPTGEYDGDVYKKLVSSQNALKKAQQQAASQGGDGTGDGEEEEAVPFGDMLTPFQAYDRQRFAAPGEYTLRGEQALANRFGQANPYAGAMGVAERVSNYQSGFTPHQLDLEGPTANSYSNVLSGFSNVNAGIGNQIYGNANQGLLGPQNYNTGRTFQDRVQDFMNPYTDQVINSSLNDINRMRQLADRSTSGSAAKAGAFGGSREALMRAENQRNALDQAASTAGQLRSSGFNTAANLAQQQEMQRLGLTAQDLANYRGLQSAGNLQGQSLTAQDMRDTRNLISQGALAAQGYRAQGGLAAQNLGAQSDRDVMNYGNQLQMQGNQLGVEQARLGEQFRQGAAGLNLQGANLLGDLTDKSITDERQRIADLLAAGQAGDARNQQDLDFIYNEFQRELDYPGRQIDLRNAAISPATGSIVTTTQPRYSSGGLPQAAGAGLATYGMLAGIPAAAPYALPAALAMGLLNY